MLPWTTCTAQRSWGLTCCGASGSGKEEADRSDRGQCQSPDQLPCMLGPLCLQPRARSESGISKKVKLKLWEHKMSAWVHTGHEKTRETILNLFRFSLSKLQHLTLTRLYSALSKSIFNASLESFHLKTFPSVSL